MKSKGTPKFIISIDDQGEVEVRDGSGAEIAAGYKGSLLSHEYIDLAASSTLMMFDSLAVMGFGNGRALTRICIKRANCQWYCSDV